MNNKNYNIINIIINCIEQIKGTNIIIFNLTKKKLFFDYIIICSANTTTQISAIVNFIRKKIFNFIGEKPIRIEGVITPQWSLMDYDSILVNIFEKSLRKYYDIEILWMKKLFRKRK